MSNETSIIDKKYLQIVNASREACPQIGADTRFWWTVPDKILNIYSPLSGPKAVNDVGIDVASRLIVDSGLEMADRMHWDLMDVLDEAEIFDLGRKDS
jgi:hypothetical protein